MEDAKFVRLKGSRENGDVKESEPKAIGCRGRKRRGTISNEHGGSCRRSMTKSNVGSSENGDVKESELEAIGRRGRKRRGTRSNENGDAKEHKLENGGKGHRSMTKSNVVRT